MLRGLMRQQRQVEPAHASVPRGMRVYAVGDIHGCAEVFDRLHDTILADAATAPDLIKYLVYLGDYVDRGPDSRGVIGRLVAGPPPGFGAIHLKGNHEAAMVQFLTDLSIAPTWLSFGGLATLASYGIRLPGRVNPPEQIEAAQQALRQALPPTHRLFLSGLRLHVTIGDYFFVHAGIRPGVALDRQQERDLIWIRDTFLNSAADHGKVVVHGHTICNDPELRANRIGIDTGAFATGRLTCLVLEGNTRRFLATRPAF